jgi:hypothetical protein
MLLTSKGYKRPEASDTTFWDSIDFDIVRLNDHNHDGSNSTALRAGATAVNSTTVVVADWGGSGPFTKTILFPGGWGMTWSSGSYCPVQCVVRNSSGQIVHCEQTREGSGLGIVLTSYVKLDCNVGLY